MKRPLSNVSTLAQQKPTFYMSKKLPVFKKLVLKQLFWINLIFSIFGRNIDLWKGISLPLFLNVPFLNMYIKSTILVNNWIHDTLPFKVPYGPSTKYSLKVL